MDEDVAKTLSQPEVGYSRVWEDHRVLSKALAIQSDDTVLCITRWESTSRGIPLVPDGLSSNAVLETMS